MAKWHTLQTHTPNSHSKLTLQTHTRLSITTRLYNYLNKEKGQRICLDISEQACEQAPRNFFLTLLSNMLTTVGDTLSNPKTVLTWVMSYVGAPVSLISLIVPVRESGSMLPQIFLSYYVRTKSVRKWIWVFGSLAQSAAVMGIGYIALNFQGATAGWLMIVCLIFFSLARAFCSLTSKDVLGKTIPKTRRGKLKGYTVAVSGVLVTASGIIVAYRTQVEQDIWFYAGIIFFAASLWILAAAIYAAIKEFPGDSLGSNTAKPNVFEKLNLIRTDKPFRNFIVARSLLLCSALTAPFYVVLAQEYLGKDGEILGSFIVANGLASMLSAPAWGRFADKSSKQVMVWAALIAAIMGIFIFGVVTLSITARSWFWLYPIAFFLLNVAHNGVRLGRKTYVVDMATGNKRSDYVAVSNTVIGVILLITGGVSALISLISVEGVILVLSLFGFAGAWSSFRLPEVE